MENKVQYLMRVLKKASFKKMGVAINSAHERSGKSKISILLSLLMLVSAIVVLDATITKVCKCNCAMTNRF